MKIFFDTEFTGLHKDTTLISIGLVSQDGKQFYAEFTDYDGKQVGDWIQENVIRNTLLFLWRTRESTYIENFHCGNKEEISFMLHNWLSQFDTVELVSDCSHYDMVLFADLFGSAYNLPSNVCPACFDICQEIARYYNISLKEAFDKSREDIISDFGIVGLDFNIPLKNKHNSLYDAFVIKTIYEHILCNDIEKCGEGNG